MSSTDGAVSRLLRNLLLMALAAVVVFLLLRQGLMNSQAANDSLNRPAPEFTHGKALEWINSPPLKLSDLRGQVVLLDFWTFDCWNCYRSFPWLKELEAKFEDQALTVIGVHTPEFDHERIRANIEKKVLEFDLRHAVMIDNDFSYWRAIGNRFWPTFYVIDRQGRVRGRFIGETHPNDRNAKAIDALITELLADGS